MSSPMRPFSVGVVPVLLRFCERLLQRLNSEPAQPALWRAETGQLALSKQGAYRIILRLVSGQVSKGPPGVQGQTAPARVIATRMVLIEAEIRALDETTQGLTAEDINFAELAQRQILWVLDEKHSGDYEPGEEDWSGYDSSPSQGQIILRQRFSLRIEVHDDPYYLVTITEMDATPNLQIPPEQD